jgi:outer membrane protein OmpA-like peptidoglycan-associated protein
MSDEKVPTDWASDVKRYVPDADDSVIAKIVNYCGIALRSRDASLVSFTDKAETDRVRENFCKKKLALEDSDEVLDAAIAAVGERMRDDTTRNRVTVYYLLAEHFGKLGLFGATAAAAAPIAPLAAAAPVVAAAAAEPVAAATTAPFVRGVYTLRSTRPVVAGGMAAAGGADDGFFGVAALVFGVAAAVMIFAAIAGSYLGGTFDAEAPPPAPVVAAPAEPAAPVIPEGAGIVSEVVEGRPKVSVYFAVGKADIAPDFAAALAPIKAWLEANPDDRVQLSGFTDPTGDAAANAELAKSRAQAVAAELSAEGVAAERMDLVKPADSSDETVDLSGARRVEITVTGS